MTAELITADEKIRYLEAQKYQLREFRGEHYKFVVDSISHPLLDLNLKGIITYANKSARIKLKLPGKDDIQGLRFTAVLDETDQQRAQNEFEKILSGSYLQFNDFLLNPEVEDSCSASMIFYPAYRGNELESIRVLFTEFNVGMPLQDKLIYSNATLQGFLKLHQLALQ